MLPIISGREGDRIKIEVTVDLSGTMLEAEESLLWGGLQRRRSASAN